MSSRIRRSAPVERPRRLRTGLLVGVAAMGVALAVAQAIRLFGVESPADVVRDFYVDERTLAFESHPVRDVPPLPGRGGSSVVIARCFRIDGARVIGWLERYTPEAKRDLEGAWSAGGPDADTAVRTSFQKEVRRPEAGAEWLPIGSAEGAAICRPPREDAIPAMPEP